MASRSVQGNMGGGGGGRSDFGRNDALQAVKNFGKQSVPNGPMGPGYGGAPAPAASSAAAAMRLEIGKTDDLIAVSQSEQLKGDPKLFANLDDEDTKELFQRRVVGILKEYIDQPSTLKVSSKKSQISNNSGIHVNFSFFFRKRYCLSRSPAKGST